MLFKTLILIAILFAVGCSQVVDLPGRLAWDHDYKFAHPDTLSEAEVDSFYSFASQDSADLAFVGFKSGIRDSLFDTLYVTKDLEYYLLSNEDFYKNDSLYFYVRASLIDSAGRTRTSSKSSDTLGVWFPMLLDGAYNLRTINLEVPK